MAEACRDTEHRARAASKKGQKATSRGDRATSACPPATDIAEGAPQVRFVPILLQKSEVASVRIFGETLRREAIDDSGNLSRVAEVTY
jgi:hypothetical protein